MAIDPTNRNTALASALCEELARSGVRHAVLSPGSRSSPIALALDREPLIDLSVVLDERVAGFVALGAALASGRPAIVACTSGSAAANLHPAIVEASEAGVAMIVLTSDRPPELRGVGSGQTIDQIKLYGAAVRWFCEVGTHQADDSGLLHLRGLGCRAAALAGAPSPGPVHLNLSWREPLGPIAAPHQIEAIRPTARAGRPPGPLTAAPAPTHPDAATIVELGNRIAAAARCLIVVGRLPDPALREPIGTLAAETGFPILAEPTSQLRFGPHSRAATIETYDLIAGSAPSALTPDLVIRFGDMPTSKALRGWLAGLNRLDQIVIDPPGGWNEPTRGAATLLRADAATSARALTEAIGTRSAADPEWMSRWIRADELAHEAIDDVLGRAPKLTEPAIHRALAGRYRDGDSVVIASSMAIRDHETFARGSAADVRFFSNRGANGIDGTISTAAGVALASARPTWVVLGDLALAHDLGGLVALGSIGGPDRAPLRIVVIDNQGGGIFDFLPQASSVEADRFSRLFTTPGNLDLQTAAALARLDYFPIERLEDLATLPDDRSLLAGIRLERTGNVALHGKIAESVRGALLGL